MYDFSAVYVKTDKFSNADVLSLLIEHHVKSEEDFVITSIVLDRGIKALATSSINAIPLNIKPIQGTTRYDPDLAEIHRSVQED